MKNARPRFKYREFSRCIEDDLNGFIYSDLRELTDLLNQVNERADRNAEMYDDLLETECGECDLVESKDKKIRKLVDDKEYYLKLLNEYSESDYKANKIFKKYGIDTIEKLDQILFNQRVW